jgi:hypothetical protein
VSAQSEDFGDLDAGASFPVLLELMKRLIAESSLQGSALPGWAFGIQDYFQFPLVNFERL